MNALRFYFLCALVWLALNGKAAPVTVDALRCEGLQNPLGVEVAQPRLSWVLGSKERSVQQSAYEIQVASTGEKLAAGVADDWDSGRVRADASVLVPYAGKALAARATCFWRVRVWDQAGRPSPWSPAATWTMGMLSPTDWHGQWIGLEGVETTNHLTGTSWIWSPERPAIAADGIETNYFRRVVTLPAGRVIKSAVFEYTGDNDCRGWLDQFDLGARNNYKTVKWNKISARLDPGQIYLFGLTGRCARTNAAAGVIGRLTIEFVQGPPLVIPTDSHWRVSSSLETGWNTVSFNDAHWAAARVLGSAEMAPWGPPRVPEDRRLAARYLRREFAVDKPVGRAIVSFCGLGLSELWLNGVKVGDAVLSPAFAQYDRRAYYVTYNITAAVRRGTNALGVILGNGRYYADRSKVYAGTVGFGYPKLRLNLRLEYTDGTVGEVVSDGSWQLSAEGPIRANNDFDGEEYDARREFSGWCQPGFRGANPAIWTPAQVIPAPAGVLTSQMQEPIRVTATLAPVSVKEIKPGGFIFDLGQNIAGWCQLRVRGPAGTVVTLRHAETLRPDGQLYRANLRGAEATDLYTLRGTGLETWEPRFVTHGFRYVEVTGYPGRPDLHSLAGRAVNDDLPVAGQFLCSNDLLNRIYTNIVWGTRSNYRSLPTDCPQRDERQGWLGDRSEECKGEAYLFDIDPLYAKWRQDMADAQRPNGVLPDIAPAYWPIYSDNVTWPSSAIIIPSALRRYYGDEAVSAQHYAGAAAWMEHMLGLAENHVLSKDNYGDWCVPPENASLIHSQDPARQTDKALLATAYFYNDLKLMAGYATQLCHTADAARWRELAGQFKTAFNAKFLNHEQGQYSNGTQTACVLPLAFGLVPEDMQARIFAHLVDKINVESQGHIGTGLIGGQYLNRVLSDHGRPDLAYAIATQKTYPSWGYMVEHGATTIWELWNGDTADPTMNSGNHVMLIGDLVVWLYEGLAGIAPDDARPGFKHIIMRPQPVGDLTFVRASHRSPYGLITSDWQRSVGRFDWTITIPANTTATVYVPASGLAQVRSDGLTGGRFTDGRAVFEVGSGSWHFTSN